MHLGFWQDAGERALRAVVGSGLITALLDWLTDASGHTAAIDWRHYIGVVAASLLTSYGVSVTLAKLPVGDGSARIGTTHPVTGDGRGGQPMTHDEIDDVEARS